MLIAWHSFRCWDWFMPEDGKKRNSCRTIGGAVTNLKD